MVCPSFAEAIPNLMPDYSVSARFYYLLGLILLLRAKPASDYYLMLALLYPTLIIFFEELRGIPPPGVLAPAALKLVKVGAPSFTWSPLGSSVPPRFP